MFKVEHGTAAISPEQHHQVHPVCSGCDEDRLLLVPPPDVHHVVGAAEVQLRENSGLVDGSRTKKLTTQW